MKRGWRPCNDLELSFGHKHFNQTRLVFWVTSLSVSSSSSPLRARTAACTSPIIPPPESVLSYLGPRDRILAVWLLWCWCRNPLPLVSCGTGGHNCWGPLGVAGRGCWDRIGLSLSGSLSRGSSLKCSRLDTKLVLDQQYKSYEEALVRLNLFPLNARRNIYV